MYKVISNIIFATLVIIIIPVTDSNEVQSVPGTSRQVNIILKCINSFYKHKVYQVAVFKTQRLELSD